MFEYRNIFGMDAKQYGLCRKAASRTPSTPPNPLETSPPCPLSQLSYVEFPFYRSLKNKTAWLVNSFNGIRNFLRRPGRNDCFDLFELNCPNAITNLNFQKYYRLLCPNLSREKSQKSTKNHRNITKTLILN